MLQVENGRKKRYEKKYEKKKTLHGSGSTQILHDFWKLWVKTLTAQNRRGGNFVQIQ